MYSSSGLSTDVIFLNKTNINTNGFTLNATVIVHIAKAYNKRTKITRREKRAKERVQYCYMGVAGDIYSITIDSELYQGILLLVSLP